MTSTQNITFVFFVLLMSLFSLALPASATEISGTLSSDGKTQAQNEGTLTQPTKDEVSGQVTANGNQLHGSVVGGREDSASLALADSASQNFSAWAIPLTAVFLATVAYLLWRRRQV